MAVRANKLLLGLSRAVLNPVKQAISSKPPDPSKMTPRQLKLMIDGKVPRSLKNLVQQVSDLLSSRKFQHLIPSTPPKLNASSLRSQPGQTLRSSGRGLRTCYAKAAPSINDGNRKFPTAKTGPFVNHLISRVISSIARKMEACSDGKCILDAPKKSQLSQEVKDQAALFAFRNGFGRSSNINIMRPVENLNPMGGTFSSPRRMLHSGGFVKHVQNRTFSTTMKLNASTKKDGKECKKKGGGLPCLKPVGLNAEGQGKKGDNKVCEKFCMPCCPPARDPPTCVVAQKKRECKKFKPPRPAYSECKKDPMKPIKPCECLIQRLPPCKTNEQSQNFKNC